MEIEEGDYVAVNMDEHSTANTKLPVGTEVEVFFNTEVLWERRTLSSVRMLGKVRGYGLEPVWRMALPTVVCALLSAPGWVISRECRGCPTCHKRATCEGALAHTTPTHPPRQPRHLRAGTSLGFKQLRSLNYKRPFFKNRTHNEPLHSKWNCDPSPRQHSAAAERLNPGPALAVDDGSSFYSNFNRAIIKTAVLALSGSVRHGGIRVLLMAAALSTATAMPLRRKKVIPESIKMSNLEDRMEPIQERARTVLMLTFDEASHLKREAMWGVAVAAMASLYSYGTLLGRLTRLAGHAHALGCVRVGPSLLACSVAAPGTPKGHPADA